MKFTATKIFRFEMAHILTDSYSVECQQIHGHSYKLEVTICSWILNEAGMVCDFKALKELVDPIIEGFDHNCVSEKTLGYNPTAENMCFHLFNTISDKVDLILLNGTLSKLRLWETNSSYATVERE